MSIYINWAAYDLLSDDVPLTEDLALAQLDHLVRLRRQGVQFDYYLMDAFWFDPDGGYREWDRRYWSAQGPARWVARCREHGLTPGLWVGCNALATPIFQHLNPPAAWLDSLDPTGRSACFFHGGFLADFMAALQGWVDQGIGLFKFDFADFDAAPAEIQRLCLPSEIRRRNEEAFRTALGLFRARNPGVRLIAYNGLVESRDFQPMAGTSQPIRRMIDTAWLDVFDAVYCGDPRPADVPCANFWRSKDIYSDHMVRYFEANNYPLNRIDNSGFMIGTTGTCYGRRKQAWRGMLILSLARGGWANTYYGNLDLLTDDDGRWFARAQQLFYRLQRTAVWRTFGALPGNGEPYGFWAEHADGDLGVIVNPAATERTCQVPFQAARVIFRDRGFTPRLQGEQVALGPEQLVVVATGAWADDGFELGDEPDVWSPPQSRAWSSSVPSVNGRELVSTVDRAPANGFLRMMLRQTRRGVPLRSSGGAPPAGVTLGRILSLQVRQNGRDVPVRINYDLAIWSGLSWAVGDVAASDLAGGGPVEIHCRSTESEPVELHLEVLHVADQ